jgi:hypothetical protein
VQPNFPDQGFQEAATSLPDPNTPVEAAPHLRAPLVDFSFSSSHASSHQAHQSSFQHLTALDANHSSFPQLYDREPSYSNFIQHVHDLQLQNDLDNLTVGSNVSLDVITPSVRVVQLSGILSDSIVSGSDQLSSSAPDSASPLDNNLLTSRSSSVDPSSALSLADGIQCTWPSCNKVFPSVHTYKCAAYPFVAMCSTNVISHHSKSHTKPFKCTHCPARRATKRHLDRHVNENHNNLEKYYCSVAECKRSLDNGGKPFPRIENCRRHMKMVHKFIADQARLCVMDEETMRIRRERKIARRVGE